MSNIEIIFQTAGAVMLSLGGASVLLFALSYFLSKIWAERILASEKQKMATAIEAFRSQSQKELESLRGRTEQRIHVHKVQFEREFQAYEKIWAAVTEMEHSIKAYRVAQDMSVMKLQQLDANNEKFDASKRWLTALRHLTIAIDTNHPFFDENIYAAVTLLPQTFSIELHYRNLPATDAEGIFMAINSGVMDATEKLSSDICNAIRKRIGSIEVVQ